MTFRLSDPGHSITLCSIHLMMALVRGVAAVATGEHVLMFTVEATEGECQNCASSVEQKKNDEAKKSSVKALAVN